MRRLPLRPQAGIAGAAAFAVALSACATGTTTSTNDGTEIVQSAVAVGDITTVAPDSINTPAARSASAVAGGPGEAAAPEPESSTTTTEPPPQFFDQNCVVVIEPGDTLVGLVEQFDDGETINRVSLRAENGLTDERLVPGEPLDVCPGNGLDDMTGEQRVDASDDIVDAAIRTNIEVQQLKLNQLFEPLGARELSVDGVSGPVTRQRLCAARLALGLEVSTADMEAGSEEEQILLAADELPPPPMATTDQDRWGLIDQTCQFIFFGETDQMVFGFPTSTGEPGHETRRGERRRAFRYDPAADNGGWHDSTDFPVSIDNPLNGNMYKPIYFDGGQAIHGANNVPTSPQSKGCARLTVENQNMLVAWLGLAGDTAPTWSTRAINLTISIQGAYQG